MARALHPPFERIVSVETSPPQHARPNVLFQDESVLFLRMARLEADPIRGQRGFFRAAAQSRDPILMLGFASQLGVRQCAPATMRTPLEFHLGKWGFVPIAAR